MKENPLENLLIFIKRLETAHLHYRLDSNRDDAICVSVRIPGELWEVDFYSSGEVELEVFRSDGKIHDEPRLEMLFREKNSRTAPAFSIPQTNSEVECPPSVH